MEDYAAACFDGSSTAVSDGTDDEHNTASSQQLNQQPGTLSHTEVELRIINREANQDDEAEQKDDDPHHGALVVAVLPEDLAMYLFRL